MADKISKRVSRIIAGGVNAVLTKIENANPEATLSQSIVEIDKAIDEIRDELGKCVATKHNATQTLGEKNAAHDELSNQITIALSEKREELARAAVSQQLNIEAQIPILEQTILGSKEKIQELENFITALQAKKREMQQQLNKLNESNELLVPGSKRLREIEKSISNSSDIFERVLNQQGLNYSQQDAAYDRDLAELEKLTHANRIEERLNFIKKQNELEK